MRENPWFGIGYADWERPAWMVGSVDHYWLITAMRFGLLPSLLILAAVVLCVIFLSTTTVYGHMHDRKLRRGLAISLAIFALGMVSVTIWLSVQVWFFILVGIAVSLAYGAADERKRALAIIAHRVRIEKRNQQTLARMSDQTF